MPWESNDEAGKSFLSGKDYSDDDIHSILIAIDMLANHPVPAQRREIDYTSFRKLNPLEKNGGTDQVPVKIIDNVGQIAKGLHNNWHIVETQVGSELVMDVLSPSEVLELNKKDRERIERGITARTGRTGMRTGI
jgi:hypothetical protein